MLPGLEEEKVRAESNLECDQNIETIYEAVNHTRFSPSL